MIDPEFFQRFADTLAEVVAQELTDRKIGFIASDIKGALYLPRSISLVSTNSDLFKVEQVTEWPGEADKMQAREFLYKYVRRWAIELGLKLSRPFVLTTYEMELPRGVEAAAIGRTPDLFLRCVVDYSITYDEMLFRADVLASWE